MNIRDTIRFPIYANLLTMASKACQVACNQTLSEGTCAQPNELIETVTGTAHNLLNLIAVPALIMTGVALTATGVNDLVARHPKLRSRIRARRDEEGNVRFYRPALPIRKRVTEVVKRAVNRAILPAMKLYGGCSIVQSQFSMHIVRSTYQHLQNLPQKIANCLS